MQLKYNQEANYHAKFGSSVWEKRSFNYGATLKSVLFQRMPDVVNEHFHTCHLNFILDCLKDSKPTMRILDIGCGYGRLSLPLVKKFPRAQVSGMDISSNYVKLYRENTQRDAFIGDIDAIPPEIGTFDYIIIVTVLMYMPDNKLKETFSGLFTHLNQGGKIILIEPEKSGVIFQTGCGLIRMLRRKKIIDTGGKCFSSREIPAAVDQTGGLVLREERIPATTFFFLVIYLLSKVLPQKWSQNFLHGLAVLDQLLKNKKLPTLWSFFLIEKIHDGIELKHPVSSRM